MCSSLAADKLERLLAKLPQIPKIRREHRVRIAADRVLGNAERRTEHARIRRDHIAYSVHGEDEITVDAQLFAEGQQRFVIGIELIQVRHFRDRH